MSTEEKTTTVKISLPDELLARAQRIADEFEVSLNAVVVGYVRSSIQQREDIEEWHRWSRLPAEEKEEYLRMHPEKRAILT